MIAVVGAFPVVEPSPKHGWELTFWMGQPGDFSIPFRGTLEETANLLGGSVALPPYDPDEDFVEGALQFGSDAIRVYYEYCLGYLALTHKTREPLDVIAAKIRPLIVRADA